MRRTARGFLWVAVLIGRRRGAHRRRVVATAAEALFPNVAGAGDSGSRARRRLAVPAGHRHRVVIASSTGRCRRGTPSMAGDLAAGGRRRHRDRGPQPAVPVRSRRCSSARRCSAGSLATAFIALAWLSFTFQALLYGAAWVRVRDDRSASRTATSRSQPWRVPQRRQNRAVAESDSPQLTHGWTPPTARAAAPSARRTRPRGPTRPTALRSRRWAVPADRGTAAPRPVAGSATRARSAIAARRWRRSVPAG